MNMLRFCISWLICLVLFVGYFVPFNHATTALPSQITIGAIFETHDQHLLKALTDIVDRVNNDRKILPRTNLTVKAHFIRPGDSFKAARTVCSMFRDRIWLILTSRSDSVNWFARSTADMLQVPHLSIQWDYRSAYLDNINFPKYSDTLDSFGGIGGGGGFFAASDPATVGMVRGSGGGFYLDPNIASGNAETGFRLREQKPGQEGQGRRGQNRGRGGGRGRNRNRQRSYSKQEQAQIYSQIKHMTLSIYPDATELSEALKDFVDSRSWKSFTLIYDSNEALIKCKDLLTLANFAKPGRPRMKISVLNFVEFDQMARLQSKVSKNLLRRRRQSLVDRDQSYYHRNRYRPYDWMNKMEEKLSSMEDLEQYVYRKLWKEIKSSEHNFVLSMKQKRVVSILREAMKIKRMSEYDNYFIVTMDIHMFDLSEFQNLEPLPNITALSLLSPKGQEIRLGDREEYFARGGTGFHSNPFLTKSAPTVKLSTYEALIYDAVTLFARAVDDLDRNEPELIVEPFVSCEMETGGYSSTPPRPWPLGIHIVDYMRNLQTRGVTGLLLFNDLGLRVNFTLDVIQLKADGLKNVAKWTRAFGIKSLMNYTFYDSYNEILKAMKFKELLITVPPSSIPYVFLRDDSDNYIGNDKYLGYCIDLLKEIAEVFRQDFQSDFKYIIQVAPDGQYGRPDKETGEWNGMFGELIRHQADLAIADLTATYLRETAVDFTMPFMNLGITILFKKPSAPEPEMFSFLKPFSVEVWLYLASAFLGVSLLLWIMSRISPYEWQAPHSCDPDPMELCNQFSIGNSLWFTIGSLMQQGSDLAPRALSTRTLATIWWFFTLIIISSYTANLAASLTLSRMAPAISSAEDLAKQTTILYGCRKGGSTWEFFANSNNSMYQRMYNTMEANPEVYINKITDAIERVRKGGYAYLAESSTIEYLIQRRCDLIQVGNWLDNKGYGIATPPDSPYRTPISNAITVLQDRGILYQLKQRWWVEKGGGLCTEDAKVTSASELNIENVGGVFLVLAMGVAIGLFSGFIEFIWKSLKIARDERESIGKLIWLEMFRICTGGGSSRPVFQSSQSSTNLEQDSREKSSDPSSQLKRNPSRRTLPSQQQFDNQSYYLPPPPPTITGSGAASPDYDPINTLRMNRNTNTLKSMGATNTSHDSGEPLLSGSMKSLNTRNSNKSANNPVIGSPASFKSQPTPYNIY